jgi:O-antigen/teichoic acid export membrane protein
LAVTFADIGMGQGLVKFVAQHVKKNDHWPFVRLALTVKLIIGGALILILWLLAQPISEYVFHLPELGPLMPLIGLSIFSLLLFGLSTATFQGLQKFWQWGGLQVGANLVRLLLFGVLYFVLKLDAFWAVVLFASSPFTGFMFSWAWLSKDIFLSKIKKEHIHAFWKFNKWTAAFAIASSFASRADMLLAARFLSLSDTGVYSLATTMVAFLPQLSSAIGAVTASKFASFDDHAVSKSYLGKALILATATSVGVALMMIPVAMFVIWFTGRDYGGAFVPFLILLLGLSVFTSLNPIRDSILYFYQKPDFFFWAGIGQTAIILIVGLSLIPKLGIMGVAITVLLSNIFHGALCINKYLSLSQNT